MEDRLFAAAMAVRRVLEGREDFSGFPRGYCQGASRVLGLYLIKDLKIGPVEIVCNGERRLTELDEFEQPRCQSHAWLEVGGFLVDMTADQFCDRLEPVIVTQDHSWHDQFQGQTRHAGSDILESSPFVKEVYQRVADRIQGLSNGT